VEGNDKWLPSGGDVLSCQGTQMSIVLYVLGLLIGVTGFINILILSFYKSIWWGLISLFVPFGYVVFSIKHWDLAKRPFLMSMAGLLLMGVSKLIGS
jgi:hypothetical protein